MNNLLTEVQKEYKKPQIIMVKSGDTIKVTQRIVEAGKQRLQVFEGLVIRTSRKNSLTYRILVRKITSGVGVEKSFLMHSPNVVKVEIMKRSKVRRNYLSYMRGRLGKTARLQTLSDDKKTLNMEVVTDAVITPSEEVEQPSVKEDVSEIEVIADDDSNKANKDVTKSDNAVEDVEDTATQNDEEQAEAESSENQSTEEKQEEASDNSIKEQD